MKALIEAYLTQILLGVIAALGFIVLILGVSLYFVDMDRDRCKLENIAIKARSSEKAEQYKKNMKSFDEAMKSIGKFIVEEVQNIDNFTKDENETECDAASRLFERARY